MLEKLINKIFFKKIVFKIVVVLTFFLSLLCFGWMCSNYHNPYSVNGVQKYDNFVEFIDKKIAPSVIYSWPFEHHEFLYVAEFIKQAQKKGIIDGSPSLQYKNYFIEQVYSCDTEKLVNFKNEYKFYNGSDFYVFNPDGREMRVDCEKAKSIPLAPESYYFVKYELWQYVVFSGVFLPTTIFILWLVLRFIIISPVLWIFKKG